MKMENCWNGIGRIVLVLLVTVLGCGHGTSSTGGNRDTIRAIGDIYEGYLRDHNGQPPKDEQAFREYLGSKQDELAKAGLTADTIFVSPRTGKPLKWIFGKTPTSTVGVRLMAYESESVEGKRLVLAAPGLREAMTDANFHTAFPGIQ